MSSQEFVIALVGAIGGIALVGFIFSKTVGLIKAWINRNNTSISESDFDRLAEAFIDHQKKTDQRIRNLEAIIANKDLSIDTGQTDQLRASNNSIEIEDEDQHNTTAGDEGNLRNMLHE